MCPMALDLASWPGRIPVLPRVPFSQWATGIRYIKKGLASLGTQLGSHVSKAHLCVTEASARRADMRHHHSLQDVRSDRYSVAQQCSADLIGWYYAVDRLQCGKSDGMGPVLDIEPYLL
jgi:hypothetical protein